MEGVTINRFLGRIWWASVTALRTQDGSSQLMFQYFNFGFNIAAKEGTALHPSLYILRDSAVRFSHANDVPADAYHSFIAHDWIEAVQHIAGARSCNINSAYPVFYCYQQDHGATFVAVQYLFIRRRPQTIFETTQCLLE